MKNRFIFLLGNLFFWYLLFVLARVAFLIVQAPAHPEISMVELLNTIRFGFQLDISMSAYLSIFPGIILLISAFTGPGLVKYLLKPYQLIVSLIFSIIIVVDISLYSYWGFRLDATPLFYMSNLKAMTASAGITTWIFGFLLIGLLTWGTYLSYFRIWRRRVLLLSKDRLSVFLTPLLLALLFLPIRGGIGISSLTISSAYFSSHQFANHAAINPMWNVAFSLTESKDLERRYVYFEDVKMNQLVKPLLDQGEGLIPVLRNDRPNIILIIVESLTAKAVGVTGKIKGITPNLDSLSRQGILFDKVFASADRTDKGLAAVVAAYPSLPGSSPLKYQKLTEGLAFLPKPLKEAGYHTSFIYGGTLDFANYRSFLVQAGYEKLISDIDFRKDQLSSKWGAWDHVVFERFLKETPEGSDKFFKTILTLTSHEPFDIPVEPLLRGTDMESKFLSSLHYTDMAIGNFIREAKKRDWWDNTLVVIIADHGTRIPGNSGSEDFFRQHIPMIWLGGALAKTDTVIHTIASQTDLAATLLKQLKLESKAFRFSKNILSAKPNPFAFYTFNEGFGYLSANNFMIYNIVTNTFTHSTEKKGSLLEQQSKAYLQYLYTDFFKPEGSYEADKPGRIDH